MSLITASEIFQKYFNQPSVVTNQDEFERLVVLPAMEEYALLMSQQAFSAAQKTDAQGNPAFAGFEQYLQSLQAVQEPEDELTNTLKEIAEMILPQYIPADRSAQQVSFSFNAEGSRYEVTYIKDADGYWIFNSYILIG